MLLSTIERNRQNKERMQHDREYAEGVVLRDPRGVYEGKYEQVKHIVRVSYLRAQGFWGTKRHLCPQCKIGYLFEFQFAPPYNQCHSIGWKEHPNRMDYTRTYDYTVPVWCDHCWTKDVDCRSYCYEVN